MVGRRQRGVCRTAEAALAARGRRLPSLPRGGMTGAPRPGPPAGSLSHTVASRHTKAGPGPLLTDPVAIHRAAGGDDGL